MSIFNYTLPSGDKFTVRGPANATQAQADKIFYEQVASGSLVGYSAGQQLSSPVTKITKFQLSRLDRGTAGVDDVAVLSILQGLPTVNSGIPTLVNVPLQNPIDQADIILAKGDGLGPLEVGPLNSFDVQKLLAQISNVVDQNFDQITQDKGIGKYGFTAYQLEQAGYVKPGTSQQYLTENPDDFVDLMNTPSVWTGIGGVTSLDQLLADENLQNEIQVSAMQTGYDSLVQTGVINETPAPAVSTSTGTVYTGAGLLTLPALSLFGGTQNLSAFSGLISNIPLTQILSTPVATLSTLASGAVNKLGFGDISTLNFNSLSASLTNQVTGQIGALVANAGKYGADAATLWANSGNFNNLLSGSSLTDGLNLSGFSGGITNLVNGGIASVGSGISGLATNSINNLASNINLNSISSNLTNLVPGLGNLTGAMDTLGKASQFATNFSNSLDLGKFGNLGGYSSQLSGLSKDIGSTLGDLQGSVTGTLGELQGSVTGLVADLKGELTGALGDLQGQLSGLVADLGGELTTLLSDLGLGDLGIGALGDLGSFGDLAGFADFAPGIGAIAGAFGGGGDLVSGTVVAGGYNNTVDRKTVDAAFGRFLGSKKIPQPVFEYPSLPSLVGRLDIQQAIASLQTASNNNGYSI